MSIILTCYGCGKTIELPLPDSATDNEVSKYLNKIDSPWQLRWSPYIGSADLCGDGECWDVWDQDVYESVEE